MKSKWLATLALALLPTSMVVPQSVASTPNCIGTDCQVTFLYTGERQTWSVPLGATDIRFEAYGAAGGRGGAGGKVEGILTDLPETLLIYVGGAGSMGNGVGGGFNGGGSAGGTSDTEGSGGGATDIRLDESLQSRIVVAGGGGGGGGEAGGNGGHGGQLSAAHGGSGQASGGGGGSQTDGGFAGVSNGGFEQPTRGEFGQGGAGGFSTFAGGGGGGGGWYGGGGGGADDNTCCSDGGGGGGGASYADSNYVTDVSHQAGVSWGHGWLVLTYSLVPTVTYLDLIQVNGERSVFTLEASEDIVGMDESDLAISGEGCELDSLTIDGTLAYGAITGCESGDVVLTVLANSFGFAQQGPPTATSVTMEFDGLAPVFEFISEPRVTSRSSQIVAFSVTDQLQLDSEMFDVIGCDQLEVSAEALSLGECSEGTVQIALRPNSLVDIWQNAGPGEAVTFSFEVDQTAPSATWSDIVVTGSGPFSYSTSLNFSEPVSISNPALAFASTAECETQVEQLFQQLVVSASCDYSSVEWSFAGQVADAAGNMMLENNLSVSANNPAPPQVVSTPEPVFVPVPVPVRVIVAPEPIEQAPLTQSPVVSESPTVSEVVKLPIESVVVVPEPQTEAIAPAPQSTAAVTQQVTVDAGEVTPVTEPLELSPEPMITADPESTVVEEEVELAPIAQPVLGEALPDQKPGFPWLPVALLVAIGAIGVGAWRLSGR